MSVFTKIVIDPLPHPVRRRLMSTLHLLRVGQTLLRGDAIERGVLSYVPDFTLLQPYWEQWKQTTLSIRQVLQTLEIPQNDEFFLPAHLSTYAHQHLLLRFRYPPAYRLLVSTVLYPPNVFVLEYLARYWSQTKGLFIDEPAGYGNMFGYVKHINPKLDCLGIDNFSQISRLIVSRFQKLTFNIPIMTFDEVDRCSANVMSVMGLPLSWIIDDVLRLNPEVLLVERRYLRRETLLQLRTANFKVVASNVALVYLERH
jgi:hypothetical protein